MPILINDEAFAVEVLQTRRASGADRHDEVWNGVYVMAPMADNEHQSLATELAAAISTITNWRGQGKTLAGANVSDSRENWTQNYRIPDVLVFLNDTSAVDCGTHWLGGPDFAIEIVSQGDRTLDKLDFYAMVGTRELLVIDRNPWQLTLYRRNNARLVPVAHCDLQQATAIQSEVIPLRISLDAKTKCMRLAHLDCSPIRDIPIQA
ncbi:MAG: Uma2 family endonuclease [Pirellulaceae bacterium]|nr:Uma2 family endonuclease [Pirellulaceae bacterium]